MTKPSIVLFCENTHQDGLTHAAEEAVLDRLNKNKWTHSLFEGEFDSEDTETDSTTISYRADRLVISARST